MKKSLGLILATLTLTSAFAGCNTGKYLGDPVGEYVSATARSNGGFAVEEGEYIYFINAQESNQESNKYGEVVKGALYRISKEDLANGVNNVKRIVPSLLVSQNMKSGIFIYDGYVYYATPTSDKNLTGEIENSYIDFKRAPLDGSAAPEDYLVRLSDNTANYRFVQVGEGTNKKTYCLYEEKDDANNIYLKSYNIDDDETTTLVKGSGITFYYDTENMENPNVYYTMGVTFNPDSENPTATSYNQLFCVNAATKITAVDTTEAKYTTSFGKTYDFDQAFMKEKNAEAKKNKAKKMPYDLKDYTTYPYVNLGVAVFDGVGYNHIDENIDTRFLWDTDMAERTESDGYTYTLKSVQNDGIYFTRQAVAKIGSAGEDTSLYYLAEGDIEENNAVGMNAFTNVDKVATKTTFTDSALHYVSGEQHYYIYINGSEVLRETYQNGATTTVKLFTLKSDVTAELLMLDEAKEYLYYYTGSGNSLARINYGGEEADYSLHFQDDPAHVEYQPMELPEVKCNKSWYKPEIFDDSLLYAGAQTYGNSSTTYYYIHRAALGTAQELKERVEKYEKVQEALKDFSKDLKVNAAINYYYQVGEATEIELAKQTYPNKYSEKQYAKISEFIAKFNAETDDAPEGELYGCKRTDFIQFIGKMKDSDDKEIQTAWKDYFAEEVKEEEEKKLPTWAIVLICVGGALVIAAGVTIPLVIVYKKRKAAALEAEATVNAYKRKKIDTTDDKTIDVYADETPAETTEEATEEAEETPVEVSEEEATEAPVEDNE